MGIALKIVAVYMLIFMVLAWWNRKRGRKQKHGLAAYFFPLAALVIIILLSVIKIFIIYKIIIALFLLGVGGLTYWYIIDR